ncbi:hypothetical protein M422DRAFT_77185 [Sphaerobolus stellatus SS14]|uniref:Uncharacterized protein n=1 Tax=Sphaerobolus stellatus (strain SS14) TaxID=990650 RepID=A0A0C9TQG9_SPHS4|nr:hypothetical protein M422DRAFT_77185 [Sphaerobolus stellatus SS14]
MDSTPPSTLPPIPPNIVQLTGPLALGYMFNWALLGALSIQTYIYYLAFPNDRLLPTKGLVLFVYIYEIVQTVLSTRDAFRNFGYGYGDLNNLNQVGWLWFSVPLMTGIISAIAQIFYAWRIWLLSHKPYIPSIIALIAVIQGAAGVWSGIHAEMIGIFSEVQVRNGTSTIVRSLQ